MDEVWWSRFSQPLSHTWQSKEHPVRLIEQAWQKDDPDPKALACYGVLWQTGPLDDPDRSQVWLRFVTGRPVSAMSTQFLEYCCERLVAQGKRNWLRTMHIRVVGKQVTELGFSPPQATGS